MFKPMIRICAAIFVAGAIALAITVAPAANGREIKQGYDGGEAQPLVKADRLPVAVKGSACSQHAWPNYEQNCLFDNRRLADKGRTVRVINLDSSETQLRGPNIQVLALR